MSAFIVNQDTINQIVTALLHGDFPYTETKLEEIGLAGDPQQLGRAMMILNGDAVKQRYGDKIDTGCLPYRFRPIPVSEIQTFKSLECWLYQCTEGDVPDTKLYKIMSDFCHVYASRIIAKLPEYEFAYWG